MPKKNSKAAKPDMRVSAKADPSPLKASLKARGGLGLEESFEASRLSGSFPPLSPPIKVSAVTQESDFVL
jgi:hypothetical protein